jgi:polynucleotide 5'-hydroxyl-kinase GRC3/NOL9
MNMGYEIDLPENWKRLDLEAYKGTLLVIGATNSGKSTFARYLFNSISSTGSRIAFLDGDPGQSKLGPPSTITITFNPDETLRDGDDIWRRRFFIGSTTPQGHMLPTVVGGARLIQAAHESGADTIVYDTCGLIDAQHGGLNLKLAKIELLRPTFIFAIQKEKELEPLLTPLRRSKRHHVIDLQPSEVVISRDQYARRAFRTRQFTRYFAGANRLIVDWRQLATFPLPLYRINRLAAFENFEGFTLGLGIIVNVDRPAKRLTLMTPLISVNGVNALRLGDLLLDPVTFHDERL